MDYDSSSIPTLSSLRPQTKGLFAADEVGHSRILAEEIKRLSIHIFFDADEVASTFTSGSKTFQGTDTGVTPKNSNFYVAQPLGTSVVMYRDTSI